MGFEHLVDPPRSQIGHSAERPQTHGQLAPSDGPRATLLARNRGVTPGTHAVHRACIRRSGRGGGMQTTVPPTGPQFDQALAARSADRGMAMKR